MTDQAGTHRRTGVWARPCAAVRHLPVLPAIGQSVVQFLDDAPHRLDPRCVPLIERLRCRCLRCPQPTCSLGVGHAPSLGRAWRIAQSEGGNPAYDDAVSKHAKYAAGADSGAQAKARWLLFGGRVTLLAGLAAVILCRVSRPIWISAPLDAGLPGHWSVNTTGVIAFLVALTLPFLIPPVGSWALATNDGSTLRVRTVLGPRHVSLASARAYRMTLPGRGTDTALVILRDARHRIAIVGQATPTGITPGLDKALAPVLGVTAPGSTGRRALRYALGWVIILAWGCFSLLVFSMLMALTGAL